MHHAARRRGELIDRDAPLVGRSGEHHLADRRTDLTHRIPVGRHRGAAAGDLRAVLRLIDVGLHDLDAAPIDVELVGDDHRQHVLDALTDLRVLRRDRHQAVRRDFHECQRVVAHGRRSGRALCQQLHRIEMQCDQHAAASGGADLQEGATIEKILRHSSSVTLRRRPAPSMWSVTSRATPRGEWLRESAYRFRTGTGCRSLRC